VGACTPEKLEDFPMKLGIHGWAAVLLACDLVVAGGGACSSSTTSGTSGSGGSSAGSGDSGSASSGGGCTVPDGTYNQTVTPAQDNPSSCTKILGGPVPVQSGSLGLVGCTETCKGDTITDVCMHNNGGVPSTETLTYMLSSTGGTGTITITTPGDAGMCSYAVTFTKM
jgi:hypothetical protein